MPIPLYFIKGYGKDDYMLDQKETQKLPPLLTPQALAEVLNVPVSFCYTLVRSKGFPSFRVGKKWLISTDKLMTWIDAQTSTDECKDEKKV